MLRLDVIALAVLGLAAPAMAQAPPKPADKPPIELTEAEKKEQEGRKVCKLEICKVFLARKGDAGDLACAVTKTWRKERLTDVMAKGKLSWPWENARCSSDIKLPRPLLARAMTEPKLEADIGKHQVTCEVERSAEKDKLELKFEISPLVTFENGKATHAKLKWGAITGNALAKSALWTASAMDNTFNVLEKTVVEEINDFIGPKCTEIKDEIK